MYATWYIIWTSVFPGTSLNTFKDAQKCSKPTKAPSYLSRIYGTVHTNINTVYISHLQIFFSFLIYNENIYVSSILRDNNVWNVEK